MFYLGSDSKRFNVDVQYCFGFVNRGRKFMSILKQKYDTENMKNRITRIQVRLWSSWILDEKSFRVLGIHMYCWKILGKSTKGLLQFGDSCSRCFSFV